MGKADARHSSYAVMQQQAGGVTDKPCWDRQALCLAADAFPALPPVICLASPCAAPHQATCPPSCLLLRMPLTSPPACSPICVLSCRLPCPPACSQLLETKIGKLEQLVRLKDAKIQALLGKLQAVAAGQEQEQQQQQGPAAAAAAACQ